MSGAETCYLDTSVVLPLYRREPLTLSVERLLQTSLRPPVISLLTELEVASAVARWVRTDELTREQACQVDRAFARDLGAGVLSRLRLEESHYWQARHWLLERRTALRTLDALHLACASAYGLTLVTADTVLARAAEAVRCPYRLLAGDA
jgi:uncharacterized protein